MSQLNWGTGRMLVMLMGFFKSFYDARNINEDITRKTLLQ